MKNQIITFLLGIFVAISFAATTSNLLTVRPQTPKSVLVKSFWVSTSIEEEVENYIKKVLKSGYIVKSVTISSDQYYQRAVVVMEKY